MKLYELPLPHYSDLEFDLNVNNTVGIRNTFLLRSYANGGFTTHFWFAFVHSSSDTRLSQHTVTRQPDLSISLLNRSVFFFFRLFVLISRSQDQTHDPCGEEMGAVPSNQWRQQRDVKQLHTGADGVALPTESVHTNKSTHFFFLVTFLLYLLCSMS